MGSATVDVFVETEKQTSATQTVDGKQVPFITYRSGEKIIIDHLQFEVGGGGTNTAAAFAKLGLQTAYLGNVGTDNNGTLVLDDCKAHGVTYIGSRTDDLTNYSVVLESALLKDRTILIYKGASERLLWNAVHDVSCKLLHVTSLSGESFRTALRVMQERKKQGTRVSCNPSNYQIEKNKEDVLAMLQVADIVTLNREEAVLLVGDGTERLMCEKIAALGPSVVVITLGAKGAVAYNGTDCLRGEPLPNRTVRETTGAGDCFAATFVAALHLGESLDTALRWAFLNVESHIAHVGAKAGFLTKSALVFAAANDTRPITEEP